MAAVAAVEATEPATYGTQLWAKTVFVNLTGRRAVGLDGGRAASANRGAPAPYRHAG